MNRAPRSVVRFACGAGLPAALSLLAILALPSAPAAARAARQSTPAAQQAPAAALVFDLNPAETKVSFTLGATMHAVHGTFQPLRGRVEYSSATGELRGEIVVDAASGSSDNASRDRKMHGEVLESEKYPAITFRPDRAEGKLVPGSESIVQIHGIFSIHGAGHELTVPVRVQLDGSRWTGSARFSVPYVRWGMKNPSAFLLRVSQTVDVDLAATGTVVPLPRS